MPPIISPRGLLSEDQILSWLLRLTPLHAALLGAALSPREQARLGPRVLAVGPGLVRAVAEAIGAAPQLFPDVPVSGEALLAAQRRADAWRALRDRLQAMARLAADAHLTAQAQLQGLVVPLVRDGLLQVPPPGLPAADLPRRNRALAPAYFILHAYDKTRTRHRAAARAARAVATPAAPSAALSSAAPSPPAPTTPPPAPPGRRRPDPGSEARRALERTLGAFLQDRRPTP